MMIVLYIILGIIALVLLLGLFISRDMSYEKSIDINASISKVWSLVSSHKGMDQWNPWHDKDPNMEITMTGSDGEVGACQHWKSDVKGVGEGKQTFSKLEEPYLAETKLEFIKPFKSVADGYMKLKEEEGHTVATWGFTSTMPYPMNIMKLFMNFEKNMDKEFGTGLNRLKDLSEAS